MKKILFLVNSASFFCSHRMPLAKAVLNQGHEVHVVTPPDEKWGPVIRQAGFHFHPVSMTRKVAPTLLPEFVTLFRLFWLYQQIRPELVHHVSLKPIIYGGIVARFSGVANVVQAITGLGFVFTSGNRLRNVLQRAMKWGLRFVGRTSRVFSIFQNPDDQNEFIQHGLVDPERTSLIKGSGVDTKEFAAHPEPRGTDLRIILPSRMLWAKGVGEFVAAAQILKRKYPHTHFQLVGNTDPDNPAAVSQKQLEAWHRGQSIEWLGYQSDMPRVFAESHIVCLPSYYREGIPKALIEAAACGRPIVTTDTSGCREIVHHDVNGLLVPPKAIEPLIDALERLILEAETRARFGEAGHQRVEAEFTIERVIKQTLQVYDRIIP